MKDVLETIEQSGAQNYQEQLEDEGLTHRKQYRKLQWVWSGYIAVLLGISLLFVCSLVIKVGKGKLNYLAYPWLIEIVIGSFLIQFIGLAYIVAKHLFPK